MMPHKGILVISLDFELYWGVRDKIALDQYSRNLLGVRSVIPRLLDIFGEYGIHATWAVVGLLACDDLNELVGYLPKSLPAYINKNLSPYEDLLRIGKCEMEDFFHYGASLIRLIFNNKGQELGSHTFGHYYCMEDGQDIDAFREDLIAAVNLFDKKYDVKIRSLIFPRNQIREDYIGVCIEQGIVAYRGNQKNWLYKARKDMDETILIRFLRVLDSYINIFGHATYHISLPDPGWPLNIMASRFLRPYSRNIALLEKVRMRRILNDLTFAARNHEIYHLWWHPHNFGRDIEGNIKFLRKILDHYLMLNKQFGFSCMNMSEVAEWIVSKRTLANN